MRLPLHSIPGLSSTLFAANGASALNCVFIITNDKSADVVLAGSMSDDDAKKLFPDGGKAPEPYLRVVKQPS